MKAPSKGGDKKSQVAVGTRQSVLKSGSADTSTTATTAIVGRSATSAKNGRLGVSPIPGFVPLPLKLPYEYHYS